MKKIFNFITKHFTFLQILFLLLSVCAIFLWAFSLTFNVQKAMNLTEAEFENYESLAIDYYTNPKTTLSSLPSDIELKVTSTSIEISSNKKFGKLVATIENDNLNFKHESESLLSTISCLFIAVIFDLLYILTVFIRIVIIYPSQKKQKNTKRIGF